MNAYHQQLLDELMDEFDFARVARAMKALGWRWATTDDGRPGVPSEPHLRRQARAYARQAIEQALTGTGHAPSKGFVGTGGFHIEAQVEGGRLIVLYARFTLTEYAADTSDDPTPSF